jgi:arylsulfatase A-like enzyme
MALIGSLAVASGCGGHVDPPSRVVLVTLDTTRADRLGCYGYRGAQTPQLDRLAEEGFLFTQASSPVPVTLPSHSVMMTGLYPPTTGVRYNTSFRLSDREETLAEVFQAAGYRTAAFVAAFPLARPFGLDQGFEVYDGPEDWGQAVRDHRPFERTAGQVIDAVLEWVGTQAPDTRYFLWVHLWDPHWPHAPPFPFSSEFRDRPYDGEIAYMDRELGRLLNSLRASSSWDRTLVLVVADHGEGLYDHGEKFHSILAYESTLRVPLLLRVPGARGGRRIEEPVSVVDLFPTLLDLCAIRPAAERRVHGTSLRPAIEGRSLPRRDLYFEAMTGSILHGWSPVEGVRSGPWKLIETVSTELYDLSADPGESQDLASKQPELAEELRETLRSLSASLDPGAGADASELPEWDETTQAALASLGYVSGPSASRSGGEGPDPRALVHLEGELSLLQIHLFQEAWPEAVERADYVLQRDPTNKFALYVRALALTNLQRNAEALSAVERLLAHYADSPAYYDLKGEIQVALGRLSEGAEAFREGRERFPESEPLAYHEVLARFDSGETRLVCQDLLPAALRQVPGRQGRLRVLEARCRLLDGLRDAALEALERAVAAGFRDLGSLRGLNEFQEVARHPRFLRLEASLTEARRGRT